MELGYVNNFYTLGKVYKYKQNVRNYWSTEWVFALNVEIFVKFGLL